MHSHTESTHTDHKEISTNRLEAFSDGVFAIIITITVLELKIPAGSTFADLIPIIPVFITYAISFQTLGTYWNNHHHLLRATKHVSPGIMWSNLNLLFWLSLIPFTTGWLGANHGGNHPIALYAGLLFISAIAYSILQYHVIRHADRRKLLEQEIRQSWKGPVSLIAYALAVGGSFINPVISDVLIVLVAIIWFIPDRRIEKHM